MTCKINPYVSNGSLRKAALLVGKLHANAKQYIMIGVGKEWFF